jgi:uncharacterized membrane protein YcaP (DUF421 family)
MEIVIRSSIIFVVLLVLTRSLKRRTLAEMAPFELILLVTVGDIVQQGVTQEDMSVTGAILAVSTFALWMTALSFLTWRWKPVGRLVDGEPLVIVRDGEPVIDALKVERLPLDEVYEAARQQGLDSLAKVRFAILEPSGRISFIKHES